MTLLSKFNWPAELIRVIDGDSYEVMLDRGFGDYSMRYIRLKGLNTPEARGEEEKKAGLRVTHFVRSLMLRYPLTHVYSYGVDSFGRILANVVLEEERDLATILWNTELAIPHLKPKRPKFEKSMLENIYDSIDTEEKIKKIIDSL